MNDMQQHRKAFAERLQEFMGEKSVLSFSKLVNIPERTINAWIRQKTTPRMEYLIMLAKQFDCTIDYLVGLED